MGKKPDQLVRTQPLRPQAQSGSSTQVENKPAVKIAELTITKSKPLVLNKVLGVTVRSQLFTKTETKVLSVLSDGLEHSKEELLRSLGDELANDQSLSDHLKHMRKKLLADYDLDIVHRASGRRIQYLLVKRAYVMVSGE